ncbi:hypothetical protein [Bacteroides faecis]|uniref:hypothetical protein n=1 Tax=Bacteroides faecis TaxID=674529 RepID=UPI00286E9F44|nr:hypothetical protein [Bacteroides faecis]MCS2235591.1 hypothetical protein [Bacteroides faecis]
MNKLITTKQRSLVSALFGLKKKSRITGKRKKLDEGWSNRKSDEKLIKEVKDEVRQSIISSINQRELIEYSVEKIGDELHVTGEIKVYIKKE